MPMFAVYQPTLTDAQIAELNGPNGGWDSKPEFSAYAAVTTGTFNGEDDQLDGIIRRALSYLLFNHVADIKSQFHHDVFQIGNVGPESLITRTNIAPAKSVSVGDIVVSNKTNTAWYCNRMGWNILSPDTLRVLQALANLGVGV